MSGQGSGAFSKSKGKSQQESGTTKGQRKKAFRDIFSNITGQPGSGTGGQIFPGQFGNQGLHGVALQNMAEAPLLDLASNDLTLAQDQQATGFLADLMRSQFAKQSAGASLQGQNSVNNISNLVTTAAERSVKSILPTTLQLAGQNRLFNTTSPQRSRALGFEQELDLLRILGGLATGGSTGSASNKSFAFSASGGGGVTPSGGGNSNAQTESSIRYKEDVEVMVDMHDKLMQLQPMMYHYNTEDLPQEKQYGFIAEEVSKVIPETVYLDEIGRPDGIYLNQYIPMLVQAYQSQSKKIEELTDKVKALTEGESL